jgi:hypothetical protein
MKITEEDRAALEIFLGKRWPDGDPDAPKQSRVVHSIEWHGGIGLFVVGLQFVDPTQHAQAWYPHAMGAATTLLEAVQQSLLNLGLRERQLARGES